MLNIFKIKLLKYRNFKIDVMSLQNTIVQKKMELMGDFVTLKLNTFAGNIKV